MPHRIADTMLFMCLISLPLFGMTQACGSDAPPWPDTLGDGGQGGGPEPPPGDNHAPVAVLSVVGPEEGPTPFTAHLDGSASYDPDGDPLEYLWVLSDGASYVESVIQHEFVSSGRHQARLVVTDPHGLADEAGPSIIYCWGLANSPWPKFAHDQRNSGVSPNVGPMMDLEHADQGGAFPRYWRGGIQNSRVSAVCVGYDGLVIYTQGSWLRARTSDGGTVWDTELDSTITAWPAVMHDGSILLGTKSGWLYRVDQQGEVIWRNSSAADLGMPTLGPSINIGNDGSSYVAACNSDPEAEVYPGLLLAFDRDGECLWSLNVPSCSTELFWDVSSLVPAITPSGGIVLNGRPGYLITAGGHTAVDLSFPFDQPSSPCFLGPPSISDAGLIAFTNQKCPVFHPDGTPHTELFTGHYKPEDSYLSIYFYCGYAYAPVWGTFGVSQLAAADHDLQTFFFVNTRTIGGAEHRLQYGPPAEGSQRHWVMRGASQDGMGRLYVSCLGLHAISPTVYDKEYPYAPRRYSLWSYTRPSTHMTAPVIGDDGWLYLGYGNDILAIGD